MRRDLLELLNGVLNVRGRDIKVRDGAKAGGIKRQGANAALLQGRGKLSGGCQRGINVNEHHVGWNCVWLRMRTKARDGADALGKLTRMRVVMRQAFDVVVQREQSGAREQAALTHSAAKHFSQAASAFDGFCWAAQRASGGTAKSF